MNEVIVNKPMQGAALDQSATTSAALSAFVIHAPR